MKTAQLLDARRANWDELEGLCARLERHGGIRRATFETLTRFGRLYRAACADLALADAYRLPEETTEYLHHLVGRAHNLFYRSRRLPLSRWIESLLVETPRRLVRDRCLWLALAVFWGVFGLFFFLAAQDAAFAKRLFGEEQVQQMEEMFAGEIGRDPAEDVRMAGFYVMNNAGIGLRCFASGLIFGVGGLPILVSNAAKIGCDFGHMTTTPHWANFSEFVTAHGPFELTAIALSAAAGMRLGFALIDTKGLRRTDALKQAAVDAVPTMWAFVVLFVLAALIEGFVSASPVPYAVKVAVAGFSCAAMAFYVFVLGFRGREAPGEIR